MWSSDLPRPTDMERISALSGILSASQTQMNSPTQSIGALTAGMFLAAQQKLVPHDIGSPLANSLGGTSLTAELLAHRTQAINDSYLSAALSFAKHSPPPVFDRDVPAQPQNSFRLGPMSSNTVSNDALDHDVSNQPQEASLMMVDHTYVDYCKVDEATLSSLDEGDSPPPEDKSDDDAKNALTSLLKRYGRTVRPRNSGGVAKPFPERLMEVLDKGQNIDIIAWRPHGRAFFVKNPKGFAAEVLPHYFKQSHFTSFTRQLNLWGFKRITRGPDAGSYYHELFLRGRTRLAKRIRRQKLKGTGIKLTPNPDAEPNFYHMPEVSLEQPSSNSELGQRKEAVDEKQQTKPLDECQRWSDLSVSLPGVQSPSCIAGSQTQGLSPLSDVTGSKTQGGTPLQPLNLERQLLSAFTASPVAVNNLTNMELIQRAKQNLAIRNAVAASLLSGDETSRVFPTLEALRVNTQQASNHQLTLQAAARYLQAQGEMRKTLLATVPKF